MFFPVRAWTIQFYSLDALTHITGKNNARSDHDSTDVPEVQCDNNEEDMTQEDLSENSITELREDSGISVGPDQDLLPEGENRRGTFTFTIERDAADELANQGLDAVIAGEESKEEFASPTEDVTFTQLFRSPTKGSFHVNNASPEKVEYPKLPQSESEEIDYESEAELDSTDRNETVGEIEEEMAESIDHEDWSPKKVLQGEIIHSLDANSDGGVTEESEAITSLDNEARSSPGNGSNSPVTSNDINYPQLPSEMQPDDTAETSTESPMADVGIPCEDVEMSEVLSEGCAHEQESALVSGDDISNDVDNEAEEEFTEASLQLNIQRDYEAASLEEQSMLEETAEASAQNVTPTTSGNPEEMLEEVAAIPQLRDTPLLERPDKSRVDDITAGLTLSFTPAKTASAEPTPRKLHSPPPPPVQSGVDDVTMTIALDDDTALLKDFLNRAAASKAEKAAILTHRRESLQNRRDSDVIRHALASPRKVLEDKDPNSPSKHDPEVTLDLSQALTLHEDKNATSNEAEAEETTETGEAKSGRGSRRSSRTKKSRLPAPATATQGQAQTSKIAIRRTDGNEHVVLKKSDAQELATLTRANTRKNKQGAFGVTVRLLKIAVDSANLPPIDDSTKELIVGKNVRWDEQLAYYQENPETIAEAESLATPDELGMPDVPTKKPKAKVSKNSTPKIRRVRGLGTANGTPAKGLLAPASLLPAEVQEEKEAAQAPPPPPAAKQLPRPKASKIKKMPVASSSTSDPSTSTAPESKLPALEVAPVGLDPPPPREQRRSRLAAPKKVTLPTSTSTTIPTPAAVPAEGKENSTSHQRTGLSAATPKKGIPAPKVIIPPSTTSVAAVGMESGLPRRRGRRVL